MTTDPREQEILRLASKLREVTEERDRLLERQAATEQGDQVVGRVYHTPAPNTVELNSVGRELADGAALYAKPVSPAEQGAGEAEIHAYDPPAICTHGSLRSAKAYQEGAGIDQYRIVPLYRHPTTGG